MPNNKKNKTKQKKLKRLVLYSLYQTESMNMRVKNNEHTGAVKNNAELYNGRFGTKHGRL
jgi:hypothetical protein